jgi:hypothetical protein
MTNNSIKNNNIFAIYISLFSLHTLRYVTQDNVLKLMQISVA